MIREPALVVLAKAPVAGRVKTRLCPPCTPAQAATLAGAALRDTLAAVRRTKVRRRLLVLDGDPAGWAQPDLELVGQRGDGLDERLAAAFEDVGAAALLVGMDTPQVDSGLLSQGVAALVDGAEAVLGPADDGGFWAIGLRTPDPACFLGVPMSTSTTGAAQLRRLRQQGCRVRALPALRDVDTWDDALAVASSAPGSDFAAGVAELTALQAAHPKAAVR